MNRHVALRAVIFAVMVSGVARLGPKIGEALTPSDALGWQLLPWGILALCWAAIWLWLRHARRAP